MERNLSTSKTRLAKRNAVLFCPLKVSLKCHIPYRFERMLMKTHLKALYAAPHLLFSIVSVGRDALLQNCVFFKYYHTPENKKSSKQINILSDY